MNWSRERVALLAVFLTNALPVVGVTLLGWSLTALVLVYWAELGVALSFAAVRALFARRPPEYARDLLVVSATAFKRGGWPVPGTGLRIQVANVPVVVVAVPAFGLVWLVSGAVAVGGLESAVAGEPFDERAATTAGVGIVGVALGRTVETVSDYFVPARYEDVNAQLALQSAIWPVLVVGFALVVGGLGLAAGAPTGALLIALVGTKSCFDLASVYRERFRAFDERTPLSFGWAYDPPAWTSVDGGLSEPVETARPHPGAVLVSGVVRGFETEAAVVPALLGVGTVGLALASGESGLLVAGGGLTVGTLLLLLLLGTLDQFVRYLPMEYRAGENDAVVGYDRLLGTLQWRVPAWKIARCDTCQTVPDRLFGTKTVIVSHDGRTIHIPHVRPAFADTR